MESSSARAVMLNIVPTSPVLTGEEGVSCFPSWLGARAGMGKGEVFLV